MLSPSPQPAFPTTQLTLVPLGGLCNRLRALRAALHLLRHHPAASLRCLWSAHRDCGAEFTQLFTLRLPFELAVSFGRAHALHHIDRYYNLYLPSRLRRFYYDRQFTAFASQQAASLVAPQLLSARRVFVATGSELCATPAETWQWLHPLPHLQARIDQLSAHFNAHTIGLHIRRTDNQKSIAHSSLAQFEAEMAACIAADPATHFFLATDEAAVRQRLCTRFPQRISMQPTLPARSSLAGAEAAVVDLWTLARTQRLIGSYWSSFTDSAAQLGNLALTIPSALSS